MPTPQESRPDEVEGEAFSAGRAGSPDERGVFDLSELGPPPWRPICITCGVQFAPTDVALKDCPICADERQYTGWQGQQWTSLDRSAPTPARHEDAGRGTGPLQPRNRAGDRDWTTGAAGGHAFRNCHLGLHDLLRRENARARAGAQPRVRHGGLAPALPRNNEFLGRGPSIFRSIFTPQTGTG